MYNMTIFIRRIPLTELAEVIFIQVGLFIKDHILFATLAVGHTSLSNDVRVTSVTMLMRLLAMRA
jgi:hypothetical protein